MLFLLTCSIHPGMTYVDFRLVLGYRYSTVTVACQASFGEYW